MSREIHDHYFNLAKREGYVSRAAYKLIEIDDRRKLLKTGDKVLDCGAAPGGWTQVAAARVGPQGLVVAIDLQPLKHNFGPTVVAIEGDLAKVSPEMIANAAATIGRPIAPPGGDTPLRFDVVLSDMAPNTTGDPRGDHFVSARLCNMLLDRCPDFLKPGGNLVIKVYEGADFPALLERTKSLFNEARAFKPKASRSESVEIYVIGQGYRPRVSARADAAATAPPRRPPTAPGWGSR